MASCAAPPAVDDDTELPPAPATLRMNVAASESPQAISIEGELISDDGVDRSNLQLAMLWQAGCGSCLFGYDDGVSGDDLLARIALQPLTVDGDIATGFRFDLAEPPPSFMIETTASYFSGVVVLTESGTILEHRRDPSSSARVGSYPLLFDEDRIALRVGSMLPLYVGYAVEASDFDLNLVEPADVDDVQPLSPGYHAAAHDGGVVNLNIQHNVCTAALPENFHDDCEPLRDGTREGFHAYQLCSAGLDTDACGVYPDPFATIDVLAVGDSFDFTIGGPQDLIRALVGLSIDDFS